MSFLQSLHVEPVYGSALIVPVKGLADDYSTWSVTSDCDALTWQDWIPRETPTSEPFLNINRAADPVRFAGTRFHTNGLVWTDAILEALARAETHGARPDRVWMHPFHSRWVPATLNGWRGPIRVQFSEDIPIDEALLLTDRAFFIAEWPGDRRVIVCRAPSDVVRMWE